MRHCLMMLVTLALVATISAPSLCGEGDEKDFGFKFGGFLKADLMYDTNRLYPGNYVLYVPAYTGENNNEFFLTARESRLSLDFWWKEEAWTTTAYMEFDWQNDNTLAVENKAVPMIRHAYLKFGKCNWTILAGQTSDIISPLVPATANYTVLWDQGNIGYRRAQMRFSTWKQMRENCKMSFDVGLTRNITGNLWDDGKENSKGSVEDGADAGMPAVQGRLGLGKKMGEEGKFDLGLSGHFGQETYGPEDSLSIDSWSFNADLAVVVNSKVGLKGEFFMGENLGQYLGGIGQSLNPINEALPAMGGWAMLSLTPKPRVTFNIGYGFDDPDEAEWTCPEDGESYVLKDMNSEMFGNVFYNVNKNVQAIFEVAYMKTEYLSRTNDGGDIADESDDFNALRFQLAFKCAIK